MPASDIFVALFHRMKSDSFHWIIAVAKDDETYVKFHARNSIGGLWSYESVEQRILDSATLTALVKIGNLSAAKKTIQEVDEVLKEIAMATPKIDGGRRTPFDCKIWIRVAVRTLNENGFLKCDDPVALENECQALAKDHAANVIRGSARYKIYQSGCCTSI